MDSTRAFEARNAGSIPARPTSASGGTADTAVLETAERRLIGGANPLTRTRFHSTMDSALPCEGSDVGSTPTGITRMIGDKASQLRAKERTFGFSWFDSNIFRQAIEGSVAREQPY